MPIVQPAKRIHSPTNGSQLVLTFLASDRVEDMRDVTDIALIMRYEDTGTETALAATLSAATAASVKATHIWVVPETGASSVQAQELGVYSFRGLATLTGGALAKLADDPVYVRVVPDNQPID
jgi:hypothetical protein